MKTEAVRIEFCPRFATHDSREQNFEVEERMMAAEASVESLHFWELLDPHKRRLYNFILKSLSYSVGADDVYQETIFRGLKYFGSYKKDLNFKAWLFKIAHHEIKKHRRQAGRSVPLENPDMLRVKDGIVDQVLVREVYRLAETLKPVHRDVFFLFYDSGMSIGEISKATGLKEGNVKFILNRIRKSLRRSLGE